MGISRVYLIIFCLLTLILIDCGGPAFYDARSKRHDEHHKKRKFISLEKYIEFDGSSKDVPLNIQNQIDPDMPYFNRNIYISFASIIGRYPFFSRVVYDYELDIYFDYKFLNKFDLVFTKEGSNKIIGHIKQTIDVKKPRAKYLYFISPHQISADSIDIYGFYNDSLVCKSKFENSEETWNYPNPYSPALKSDYNVSDTSKVQIISDSPHPFSPCPPISFSVKDSCNVRIVMYDDKGRVVDTLINEIRLPGNYSMPLDAITLDLDSGLYFYKTIICDDTTIKTYLTH